MIANIFFRTTLSQISLLFAFKTTLNQHITHIFELLPLPLHFDILCALFRVIFEPEIILLIALFFRKLNQFQNVQFLFSFISLRSDRVDTSKKLFLNMKYWMCTYAPTHKRFQKSLCLCFSHLKIFGIFSSGKTFFLRIFHKLTHCVIFRFFPFITPSASHNFFPLNFFYQARIKL